MAIKLGGNIKANLPQPGETKAQFMTRSVRILMKSGKSKSMAMGIAERIWNNIAQSSSVQSNQVDSDVTFVGQPQRQASGPGRGSVAVRQMGSFNDFSNRINESKMNTTASKSMQTSQMEFLSGLKDVITSQLISPLASIMRQQSAGPGRYIQNARNYNGMGGDSSALSNLFSQQVSLQSQTLGAINQLVSMQSNIGQELATIRSTGMKIRRLAKGPRKPRPADFWEDFESADPQLKSPFVETFMKHMQGEFPILDKIATAARVIANPIQTLRKTVGKKLRKGVAKLREMSGDIDYRFEQDPDQVKREAGLVVLDKERLADKVTSEILPQKLAELTDDNKQQIDVLRNIYDVNKQHLSFVTKGKVQHQYIRTLDTSAHIFDRETGKYFTEDEFKNQLQSRENQLRRYMKKADRIRSLDPTTGLIDFITKGMDSAHKALTGVSSYQDRDDRIKTQVNKLTMDADEAAKREEDYYQRRGTVISRNEMNSARQYGPRAISEDAAGKIIGIKKDATRLNTADGPWSDPAIRQQYLDQLGNDAFRQAAFDPKNLDDHSDRYIQDGNSIYQIDRKTKKKKWLIDKANKKKYKVDEFGNKEYRYAKDYSGEHDETGKPKLIHGQFYQDDYEFSGSKKRSMNPFRMLSDIYGEYQDAMSAFHEESKKHEDGLPGIVRFLTKFIPNPKAREGKDKIEKIQDPDIKKHLLKDHKSLDNKYGFKHWDTIPPNDLYENTETSSDSEEKATVTRDLDFSNLEQLKFFVINSKKIPLFTRDASRDYLMKKLKEYNGNIIDAINNINCCCDDNSNLEKTIKDGIDKIDKEKKTRKPKKPKHGSKTKSTNVKDELDNEKKIREQIERDKVISESRDHLKNIYEIIKKWDENGIATSNSKDKKDKDKEGILSKLWGGLKWLLGGGALAWLWGKTKNFIKHPIESIKSVTKSIKELPGKMWDKVKSVGKWIKEAPGKAIDSIKGAGKWIKDTGAKTIDGVKSVGKWIKEAPGKAIDFAGDKLNKFNRTVKGITSDFMSDIRRGHKLGFNGANLEASSGFKQKIGWGLGKFEDFINNPEKNIKQIGDSINKRVTSLFENIGKKVDVVRTSVDNFGKSASQFVENTRNMGKSLVDGLGKGLENVRNIGKTVVDSLGKGVESARSMGKSLVDGLGKGIETARTMGKTIVDSIGHGLESIKSMGKSIFDTFKNFNFSNILDKGKNLISGAWDKTVKGASNLWNKGGNFITKHPQLANGLKVAGGALEAANIPMWIVTANGAANYMAEKTMTPEDYKRFMEAKEEYGYATDSEVDLNEIVSGSFHTGGLVKSAVNSSKAKMQEKLGLKPGEVPIIAKEGEYVLNQEDTKKYLNESETESEESANSSYGSISVLKQILTELKELKEEFIDFYDDFYGLQFTFYKPLMKLFIDPLDKWNGYYEFWRSLLYNKDLHTGTALGGSGSTDNAANGPGILDTIKNKAAEVYNNVKQGISDKVERVKQRLGINKDDQIKSAANLPTYNGTTGSTVGGAISNKTLSYKGSSKNGSSCDPNDPSCNTQSMPSGPASDFIQRYTEFARSRVGSRYTQNTDSNKGPMRTSEGWYDCSSLVSRSIRDAGLSVPITNTGSMIKDFSKFGFKWHPGRTKRGDDPNLQYGDILLRKGHTEIYVGDGKTVGAKGEKKGVLEDVNKQRYDGFLRYEGNAIANSKSKDDSQQSLTSSSTQEPQSAVEANAPSNPGKLEEIANVAQNEPSIISENSPSGPSEESLKSSQCPLKSAASNLSSNIETPLETAQKQAANTLQTPRISAKQNTSIPLDSNNNIKQTMKSAESLSTQASTPDISSAQQNAKSVPANNEQTKFQNGNAAYKHPEPVANTMTSGGISPMVANVTQQHRAQQESDRATDPNTDSIIDRIFANTMYNFQQASNNYALGNNPMSALHIA